MEFTLALENKCVEEICDLRVLQYLIRRDGRGWRFGQGGQSVDRRDRRWGFLLILTALHRTFLGNIFILFHILSISVGNCSFLDAVCLSICAFKRVVHLKGF